MEDMAAMEDMVDTEDTVERDLPKPTMDTEDTEASDLPKPKPTTVDTVAVMEDMVAMEVMVDTEDTAERDPPTPIMDMEVMVVMVATEVAMEATVVDTDMAVNTKFSIFNIPNTTSSPFLYEVAILLVIPCLHVPENLINHVLDGTILIRIVSNNLREVLIYYCTEDHLL